MPGTVTTTLTTLTTAESTTGWTGLTNLDSDAPVQGSGCVGGKVSNSTTEGRFDNGSGIDLSGRHLYVWAQCSTPGLLAAKASGGLRIRVTDTSGNTWGEWRMAGNDTYNGGWRCFVVDVDRAYDAVSGGSGATRSAIRYVGVVFTITGMISGNFNNCLIDAIRYSGTAVTGQHSGTAIRVTGGTTGAPATLADLLAADENNANRWGIIRKLNDSVYLVQGEILIGDGSTATVFRDTSKIVIFEDQPVRSSLYKMLVYDHAEIMLGTKVGSGDDALATNGVTITSPVTRPSLYTIATTGTAADRPKVFLYGVTWNHGNEIFLNGTAQQLYGDNIELVGSIFADCGRVRRRIGSGTPLFVANTISSSVDTTAAFAVNDSLGFDQARVSITGSYGLIASVAGTIPVRDYRSLNASRDIKITALATTTGRANTFEGGNDEDNITVANSPGVSGTGFDTMVVNRASVFKYDSARAAHGTLSGRVNAAANEISYAVWNVSGTQFWGRLYVYLTANPAFVNRIVNPRDGSGNNAGAIAIRTDGTIRLLDSAAADQGTSTATIALNQWVRIEFMFNHSTALGQIECKLFNDPESSTPTETITSGATINTGSAAGNYRFGIANSAAGAFSDFWLDALDLNQSGYPGPFTTGATQTWQVINPVWGATGNPILDWGVADGAVEERFDYLPTVTDAAGSPLQGVRVYVWDASGAGSHVVDNQATDASGQLASTLKKREWLDGATGAGTSFGPFTQRFVEYGKNPFEQALTVNAKLEPFVTLTDDPGITDLETVADLVSGVTVTDARGAPQTYESKDWSWVVDCGNNSLANVYHWLSSQAQKASPPTWAKGMLEERTRLLIREGSTYRTESINGHGVYLLNPGAGTISEMRSDDDSAVIPPISTTHSLTGLKEGSEARYYRQSDNAELFGVESVGAGGRTDYAYLWVGDVDVYIHIHHVDYIFIRLATTLTNQDTAVPIQQQKDRQYANP